jgi:hypothetical protein
MTVNRERLTTWCEAESVYWDHVSLGYVARIVANLIDKYGPDAELVHTHEQYDDAYYFAVTVERPETDEEMAARIRREELEEDQERRTFERLKKKYEGGGK